MLVTFHSPAYADITLFGDVAVQLLELMGHSGSVPSAIMAEDIPAALERLKQAVKAAEAKEPKPEANTDEGCENRVSLAHRALPLIELLEAAIADNADVMWDK
ncbi:MAG: DUF1840 domain-containing protein [Gammaproteobacteria bacterium]|nr:DUF1840 domain-containing protein [Gammaproteobacteria bacterium]